MIVKQQLLRALFIISCLVTTHAYAELTIEITQGVDNPTPVAISPFSWSGTQLLPENVGDIIENDLKFSGRFNLLPKADMLSYPDATQKVFYRDWRALGRDYLLVGKISPAENNKVELRYSLVDINRQKKIFTKTLTAPKTALRDAAHRISDQAFEALTGIKGAFSTKILYVTSKFLGKGNFNYKLWRSDFDGERATLLLNSDEPIMSPTWSPNAKDIAYVSFESGRPSIFQQTLSTGKREKLTNFKGMNSSPAFSPNGKEIAFVLSKDGTPDLYIMNLATKKMRKVGSHNFAIDTEPTWLPDGKSIAFTSNRGGKPQIYQVELASGTVKRLSYDGDYNARARAMPDGSGLIVVNRTNGQFQIARYDIERQRTYVLTNTDLDESPSIAPNGSMVMYAAKRKGQGVLAVVSVDGMVKSIIPSKEGISVREPAWSPFIGK